MVGGWKARDSFPVVEKKELISRGPGSNSGRDLPRDTLSALTLDKKVAPPREGACPGWLEFLEF